jgi:hypothetical protein
MLRSCRSAALLILSLSLIVALPPGGGVALAQDGTGIPLRDSGQSLVRGRDLICAGFISKRRLTTDFKIVGGEKEDEIKEFTTSNIVYLNYGQRDGASVGESMYVIRPKGSYENPFTGRDIGYFHEEIGVIRIIAVQRKVSTARVETACDTMHMGDVVRPFDAYVAPDTRAFIPLNRYDLPTGKLSGQIILSRGHRDYLSERDIVYLDIGADQGVRVGQYYTVYREPGEVEGPVGPEDFTDNDSLADRRDSGYSHDPYRGGDFSQMAEAENPNHIREEREGLPRKVTGEICIIRLEGRSATGIVTRVAGGEVNVGDYVELQ